MIRQIKPLKNGIITSVSLDEAGFATVHLTHSSCDNSSSYAFAPLQTGSEDFECSHCGKVLLRLSVEESEEVPDASEL